MGVPARFVAVGGRDRRWTAPARYTLQLALTIRILLRERPQLLIVMAPPLPLAIVGLSYQRLARVPLVIDAHTGAVINRSGRVRHRFLLLARFARITIVTSDALATVVRRFGARTVVLHDPPWSAPLDNAGPALPSHSASRAPVVVMPCGWAADEPLDIIASAAALVPEIVIAITGRPRGPMARQGSWPENVRLLGHLPDDAYATALRSASGVLAVTTRALTMQRAAYEAMIVGRPVVAADMPVLREYLQAGTLFAPITPDDIAAALRRCVAEEQELAEQMLELRDAKRRAFQADLDRLVDELRSSSAASDRHDRSSERR